MVVVVVVVFGVVLVAVVCHSSEQLNDDECFELIDADALQPNNSTIVVVV